MWPSSAVPAWDGARGRGILARDVGAERRDPEQIVETVRIALSALDQRDVDGYLRVASPEIEVINPASEIEGAAIGHAGNAPRLRANWRHPLNRAASRSANPGRWACGLGAPHADHGRSNERRGGVRRARWRLLVRGQQDSTWRDLPRPLSGSRSGRTVGVAPWTKRMPLAQPTWLVQI